MVVTALSVILLGQAKHKPAKLRPMKGQVVHDFKFGSKKALTIWLGSMKAMDLSRPMVFTVSGDTNREKIWLDPNHAKVAGVGYAWAYNNGQLEWKKGSLAHKAKVGRRKISKVLAKDGIYLDPRVQNWSIGTDQFETIGGHTGPIRWIGKSKVLKADCDLLVVQQNVSVITVAIRQKDHLIASIGVDSKDKHGHVLTSTTRTFDYHSVNKAIPASQFSLE